MTRRDVLAAALLSVPARSQTFGALGVGVTPARFPRHGPREVTEMFRKAREVGPVGVFIYQWSQQDFQSVARTVVKMAAAAGLTPIIGLSPTVLSGARDRLDVPERVRRAAHSKLSFRDPAVHRPFIADALELAKLRVPYLCLATEINFLAFGDIEEYVTFAHVYKKLHAEVKKISPRTRVFVSFQWDFFHDMRHREPRKIQEHAKLIRIFEPELDAIALTSYPGSRFNRPEEIPQDYYSRIFDYAGRDKPVVFMEIGWPSTGRGSETSQAAFTQRLPGLMSGVKPEIVAWSLLHDVRHPELGSELSSTGLLTTEGRAKPAFDAILGLR